MLLTDFLRTQSTIEWTLNRERGTQGGKHSKKGSASMVY